MVNTHQCKSMEHGEVWISEDNDEWHLNINRVATEQDLDENHHLCQWQLKIAPLFEILAIEN